MKHSLIILVLACTVSLNAQYEAGLTQYMFNESFVNPAYVGSGKGMSATLLHRQQWLRFPGRPVTTTFSLHSPLTLKNMGLGLNLFNEKTGVTSRNYAYACYSYRLRLDSAKYLRFGLMGGLESQVSRYGDLKVNDLESSANDPEFGGGMAAFNAANFGFGMYYSQKNFYAGLSVPRLLENTMIQGNSGFERTIALNPSALTYFFTAGYDLSLGKKVKLRNTLMVKAIRNAPVQVDLNGSFLIHDKLWLGLGYRSRNTLTVLAGLQLNEHLLAVYSYDHTINRMRSYTLGTHEIVLRFLFPKSRRVKPVTAPPVEPAQAKEE